MLQDSQIIDLFFERSDKAIDELSCKYGKACMKLSYNILNNREDSEECVNDSYLAVWNKIPPEKPSPLITFLLKIVRNISVNRFYYNTREKRNCTYNLCLDEWTGCPTNKTSVEGQVEQKYVTDCINEYLKRISRESRVIFVRRYFFMDSYADIALLTGMTEVAIRKRISRTKKDLLKYLEQRGCC